MKARVKATGYIVDVKLYYITPRFKTYTDGLQYYNGDELDFNIEYADPDYWTRLEHQYAGMAMQGILSNQNIAFKDIKVDTVTDVYVDNIIKIAHALVEKMREERK